MADLIDGEAEQGVLAALLLGCPAGTIADVRRLLPDPTYFGRPLHRHIYALQIALLDRGVALDILTVRDEALRQQSPVKIEEVAVLVDVVPSAANVMFHAKIVRELSLRRALVQQGHQAIARAEARSIPVEQGYSETLQGLIAAVAPETDRQVTRVGESLLSATEALVSRNQTGLDHDAVSTGISGLDDLLGGITPRKLILLAANNSVGKTSLALAIGRHIAETRPVYHCSLEMGEEELAGRLLCSEARVMQGARHYSDRDLTQLTAAGNALHGLPYFVDTSAHTPQQIRLAVQALIAKGQSPVVIVDYLQLLRWPVAKDRENKNAEVGHISRFLKMDIAMALKVPVIALSQLNRKNIEGGKKRRPEASDLRDSGSLEQDADQILMLHYDGAEDGRSVVPGWESPDMTECLVRKNRGGPKGMVKLQYHRPTGTWGDWTRYAVAAA